MTITGMSILAGVPTAGSERTFQVHDPATDAALEPVFHQVGLDEVDTAARAASGAFDLFRGLPPQRRAELLAAIASNLDAARADLVARATRETGLTAARIDGEVTRTVGQLRLFAEEIVRGDLHGVRIDHANPARLPLPAPDVRQRLIPLGPVAVFGASNFPLAFSVAGGDTAAALAAGCPVIVKAHSSHAGTAELAGQAITRAVADCGLPAGVFSMLFGPGALIGQALAEHPMIKAIAFTGSQAAGTALMRTAANRPEPIPVYAEMSSINPVVLLPGAAARDVEEFAAGFTASLTLGAGQFCTNPGLLFVPTDATAVVAEVGAAIARSSGQTMLSESICRAYTDGLQRVSGLGAVEIASGTTGTTANSPAPVVFATTAGEFGRTPHLQEEVFGAAAIVVSYDGVEDLRVSLESLQGQLTATMHLADSDHALAAALVPVLERKAGRLIVNAWPTGVEVNHAMVHGGPFPATSDGRVTSVGTLSVHRFLRPVAYQGFSDDLLPAPVQDANPWHVPRRVTEPTTG